MTDKPNPLTAEEEKEFRFPRRKCGCTECNGIARLGATLDQARAERDEARAGARCDAAHFQAKLKALTKGNQRLAKKCHVQFQLNVKLMKERDEALRNLEVAGRAMETAKAALTGKFVSEYFKSTAIEHLEDALAAIEGEGGE